MIKKKRSDIFQKKKKKEIDCYRIYLILFYIYIYVYFYIYITMFHFVILCGIFYLKKRILNVVFQKLIQIKIYFYEILLMTLILFFEQIKEKWTGKVFFFVISPIFGEYDKLKSKLWVVNKNNTLSKPLGINDILGGMVR